MGIAPAGAACRPDRLDRPRTFSPNAEVSAVHWRSGGEPLPGGGMVQTVDEYIVELCRD